MWPIKHLEIIPPSRLPRPSLWTRTPSLRADGVEICNDVRALGREGSATQMLVCEECGQELCAPGGWVRMRRVADQVVWAPHFPERGEETDYSLVYESPASYIEERGAPIFDRTTWNRISSEIAGVPALEELPVLAVSEGLRILQIEAPYHILGQFPSPPKLNGELFLAVTEGDLTAEVSAVAAFVDRFAHSDVELAGPLEEFAPIEFHLDVPRFLAWTAFCRYPTGIGLMFKDGPPVSLAPTTRNIHVAMQEVTPDGEGE